MLGEYWIKLLLCIIFFSFVLLEDQQGVVHIVSGGLQGAKRTSANGREFWAFLGVPYAKPPVGSLRFKPPESAASWTGTRDATSEGSPCIQLDMYQRLKFLGTEDCLYLNVYTPQLPVKDTISKLPVMVCIHGGGYMSGSGSSIWVGPKYLMDRNVVIVTFNYRLGALGFLSTGDEASPGNNGMKDQVLALKWVQKNIVPFGGDPQKVTLFGNGAGGASAQYHMMSPMSKGLFHHAIALSGTSLCPWAYTEIPRAYAVKLGMILHCPTNSSLVLVDCLREKPADDIVKAFTQFFKIHISPVTPFGPTKENVGTERFLEEDPYSLLTQGKFNPVPFINGVNAHEGAVSSIGMLGENNDVLNKLNSNFLKYAPALLEYEKTALDSDDVSKKVKEFYFKDNNNISGMDENLLNLFSDRFHYTCAIESAKLHARASSKNTYFYMFSYRGKNSVTQFLGNTQLDLGVCHLDELLYLFDSQMGPEFKNGEPEKKISDLFTELLTTFAEYGDPTPEGKNVLVKWLPVNKDAEYPLYLRIDQEMGLQWDFPYNRMNFWKNLKLNEYIDNTKLTNSENENIIQCPENRL